MAASENMRFEGIGKSQGLGQSIKLSAANSDMMFVADVEIATDGLLVFLAYF